ncbi:Senescence regulator [Cinnamomum micranthum f. kanehirae]|uniref:Senescence regulator n=1 Tax=Cinnamomum micranthum f. kanehirae TaxID=337451 RepID=A0A3S4PZ41_9MAGN|nr:Senescence regulator [Cinnamomum micranthum f. kanehirae]
MAGKTHFSSPTYRFFSTEKTPVIPDPHPFEFDESEIWNSTPPSMEKRHEPKKPTRRISKKPVKRSAGSDDRPVVAVGSSLPVSIPDWSKILRKDCRESLRREIDGEYEEEEDWIPPHEFLAKQFERARIASFSLHEGIGRTLKGRDLSRVRDAIWEKTGFED